MAARVFIANIRYVLLITLFASSLLLSTILFSISAVSFSFWLDLVKALVKSFCAFAIDASAPSNVLISLSAVIPARVPASVLSFFKLLIASDSFFLRSFSGFEMYRRACSSIFKAE